MRTWIRFLWMVSLPLAMVPFPAWSEAPWQLVALDCRAEPVQLAVVDYQRYLAQVSHKVPEVTGREAAKNETRAAVLLRIDPAAKTLGEQGYRLEQSGAQVRVTGATEAGLVNGVYGLLRELGFRFYLGSESVPASLPDTLPVSPVERVPALKVRGVLPWYNFFNSPTAWNLPDHRAFVDALIRSGANFLGFHSYDGEPFAGYFENGEVQWGSRLVNTASPCWGTTPKKTEAFAAGTGELFPRDYFGAETTFLEASNADAVRAEQAVMRDALAYAHRRGLITALGFEMNGDPMDPAMREVFLKRLNHLLDTYPMLDLIWLWQSETQGAQGFTPKYTQHILPYALSEGSPLPFYGMARRDTFHWVVDEVKGATPFYLDNEAGKLARAIEGARLEQWANLALRAFRKRAHAPRLGISGWGGDERLLSADYYDGLDKLLPPEVVFTSLDHITPRERVDKVYARLPQTRERWPIPWLENDGDQWRPQPFVHTYEKLMDDLLRGGSQGVLGIHWRTRDIEENFAYLVDRAWNPALTADAFFQDIARQGFPPDLAEAVGTLLSDLDRAGYSWVGGSGQSECGVFSWGAPDPATLAKFEALRERARQLLFDRRHTCERARWLLNTMDWVSGYAKLQRAAGEATVLVEQARKADGATRADLARQAMDRMGAAGLEWSLWSFARRMTTRGEYGVLATINTKAVVAWQALKQEAASLAGTTAADAFDLKQEPSILMPRHWGSVPEGQAVEMLPAVVGGPAWLHYRVLGEAAWRSAALTPLRGRVFRAEVPAAEVRAPGFEFGLSFSDDPGQPMACGPMGVTVQRMPAVETEPLPRNPEPARPSALAIQLETGTAILVKVQWDDVPDADYFRVYRNDALVAETAVPFFPDCPKEAECRYRVEALRDGGVMAASGDAVFRLKEARLSAPPPVTGLRAIANRACVLLQWETTPSAFVSAFQVERSKDGSAWQTLNRLDAGWDTRGAYRDTPEAGLWHYRVVALGPTGLSSAPAQAEVTFAPSSEAPKPVFEAPLTVLPNNAAIRGAVQCTPEGAVFAGGRIEVPDSERFDLGKGMTVHFEFKQDRASEMPVLLCHGSWQIDGWFAQILGGRLMVRLPKGDAEGPAIEAGKWYSVDFVYDGVSARLCVNGVWYAPSGCIDPVPARQPLVTGGYEADGPPFQFLGVIRNLRVFNDIAVELPLE